MKVIGSVEELAKNLDIVNRLANRQAISPRAYDEVSKKVCQFKISLT
jgi:hypothetical protein